ncbi:MAG: (2Fe-2S)-binding protein [Acidobacteriota bacterium]
MDELRINSVERKEKVELIVNGSVVSAYKGESLLAALIAAGYKSLKKSAVKKEYRGGFCGMGVCFECLVTINGKPNLRACMYSVENGMEIITDE